MAIATLACFVFWPTRPAGPPEPEYHGKSLTEWAAALETNPVAAQGAFRNAVADADTNAIPVLLKLLQAHDSPLETRVFALARRQHWFHVQHTDAVILNNAGILGFFELKWRGLPAVPDLIRIYERRISPDSQMDIALAFSYIGPDARPAIPALLRETGNSNDNIRETAFGALAEIHENPELLVPLFIKGLRDASPDIDYYSARGLGNFGPRAKAAVPEIVDLIQKRAFPPPRVIVPGFIGVDANAAALEALHEIDPVVAKKLDPKLPDASNVR